MPELASVVTSPSALKYIDLPAAELNALAAKAHGWEDGHHCGEPGWFSDGKVLEQLVSSYKPAENIGFALEILKELTDEGYCIAINTKDAMVGNNIDSARSELLEINQRLSDPEIVNTPDHDDLMNRRIFLCDLIEQSNEDVIIIGGVPTKEGNPGLPQVVIDASETQLYIPELCRAITILYIVHKEGENE